VTSRIRHRCSSNMTDENEFDERIEALCDKDPRFKPQAYGFVMAALSYRLSQLGEVRHVTGQELLEGVRELGLELYGPMAKEVFNHWGLHSCSDFGQIVFNLVNEELLSKTDKDRLEDFENGFDFEEEFVAKFQW
jgi:uncharacterized repeat protein (TIGR04138 family)